MKLVSESHEEEEEEEGYRFSVKRSVTWAEEDRGFEVGVLISIGAHTIHAVAELLHSPDVLHHLLYSLRRQFL